MPFLNQVESKTVSNGINKDMNKVDPRLSGPHLSRQLSYKEAWLEINSHF